MVERVKPVMRSSLQIHAFDGWTASGMMFFGRYMSWCVRILRFRYSSSDEHELIVDFTIRSSWKGYSFEVSFRLVSWLPFSPEALVTVSFGSIGYREVIRRVVSF